MVHRATGQTVATHAIVARGLWAQARGLIGHPLRPGEALGLPRCPEVHTLFVSGALDIAHCDSAGQVLRLVANLKPFRAGPYVPGTALAWEMRAGALSPLVRDGDYLDLCAEE